jgi:hypothetical protein
MRIPSGVTDQVIYFVAVDATDFTTRETGLSSFTVYRSRNGGAAAAFTTPTVAEVSSANMPGVYTLLLDEDMTIDAGDDSQEYCLHVTHAGMAPVTRTFELYRPKVTAGETLTVASGAGTAKLGDVAHGGTAAVLTLERVVVASATSNEPAVKLTGNGTGAGLHAVSGGTGDGVYAAGTNGGNGMTLVGTGGDSNGLHVAATSSSAFHVTSSSGGAAMHVPEGITANITGNITGNLSGSVGSVTGAVGSVTGNVGGNVTGSVGSLATQAKADVNAEVLDVLNVDTFAEVGQETPAATNTLSKMLRYLFKAWRNKATQTSTTYSLFADDATTVDQKAPVSDDGTTFTKGEVTTGP